MSDSDPTALMLDLCDRINTQGDPGPWEFYPTDYRRDGIMGDVFRHQEVDYLIARQMVLAFRIVTVSADAVNAFALRAIVPLPQPEEGDEWKETP